MLVFGIFEQSIELEQALAELETISIKRENILVVFMDNTPKDTMFKEHNPYGFEIGICFGTAGGVIGASSGFTLTLGPIIWGLIGAIVGFILGFSLYILFKKGSRKKKKREHEVTVVIQCNEDHSQQVSDTLWKYHVRAVGVSDIPY
jgi:hypothetical protein